MFEIQLWEKICPKGKKNPIFFHCPLKMRLWKIFFSEGMKKKLRKGEGIRYRMKEKHINSTYELQSSLYELKIAAENTYSSSANVI